MKYTLDISIDNIKPHILFNKNKIYTTINGHIYIVSHYKAFNTIIFRKSTPLYSSIMKQTDATVSARAVSIYFYNEDRTYH